MVKNEKEILKLRTEKDRMMHHGTGSITQDELLKKVRERDSEIKDITQDF
jgi:hypothetical protein